MKEDRKRKLISFKEISFIGLYGNICIIENPLRRYNEVLLTSIFLWTIHVYPVVMGDICNTGNCKYSNYMLVVYLFSCFVVLPFSLKVASVFHSASKHIIVD